MERHMAGKSMLPHVSKSSHERSDIKYNVKDICYQKWELEEVMNKNRGNECTT